MFAWLTLRPRYVPPKRRWARGVHSVRSYGREKLRSDTRSTACHLLHFTFMAVSLCPELLVYMQQMVAADRATAHLTHRRFCSLQNGAMTVLSWTHVNVMLLRFWNVSYKYLWKLVLMNSSRKHLNVPTLKLRPQSFLHPQYLTYFVLQF
jgi:hypothetical protein